MILPTTSSRVVLGLTCGREERSRRLDPELLVASKPDLVALPGDPVVAARQGDVAGHFLDVANDCQAPSCSPCQFSFGHRCLLVNWRPKCQQTPSVLYLVSFGIRRPASTAYQGDF